VAEWRRRVHQDEATIRSSRMSRHAANGANARYTHPSGRPFTLILPSLLFGALTAVAFAPWALRLLLPRGFLLSLRGRACRLFIGTMAPIACHVRYGSFARGVARPTGRSVRPWGAIGRHSLKSGLRRNSTAAQSRKEAGGGVFAWGAGPGAKGPVACGSPSRFQEKRPR
jgi:hypothetical protein